MTAGVLALGVGTASAGPQVDALALGATIATGTASSVTFQNNTTAAADVGWPATLGQNITIGVTGVNGGITAPGASLFCGNFAADGTTPLIPADLLPTSAGRPGVPAGGAQVLCKLALQPTITAGAGTYTATLSQPNSVDLPTGSFCLPGGIIPCLAIIATQDQSFSVTVPVANVPATLQFPGATAARATGTQAVQIGGAFFQPGLGALTLCDKEWYDPSAVCNAAALTDVTPGGIGFGANGQGGGAFVVNPGTAPGDYFVKVTSGTSQDTIPFRVLGTPTASLNPGGGAAGSTVSLTGSNFDTNAALTAQAYDATNTALGSSVPLVSDNNGGVGPVPFTVPANSTYVKVSQDGSATLSANAAWAQAADDCTVFGGPCTTVQQINQQVNAGVLSMHEDGVLVAMPFVELGRTVQTVSTAMNQLHVYDQRSTQTGWTVTGFMKDLVSPAGGVDGTIPAGNVNWKTKSCVAATSPPYGTIGNITGVTAGPDGVAGDVGLGINGAPALCTAVAGGGNGVFDINAVISVAVEPQNLAGLYSGLLTLTLTGT